jgi:hypothetical protein
VGYSRRPATIAHYYSMATVAHIGLGLIAYVLCPLCVYINTERVAGGGIVCLELVLTYCIPCLVRRRRVDEDQGHYDHFIFNYLIQ